jgi:hypothetical protein
MDAYSDGGELNLRFIPGRDHGLPPALIPGNHRGGGSLLQPRQSCQEPVGFSGRSDGPTGRGNPSPAGTARRLRGLGEREVGVHLRVDRVLGLRFQLNNGRECCGFLRRFTEKDLELQVSSEANSHHFVRSVAS